VATTWYWYWLPIVAGEGGVDVIVGGVGGAVATTVRSKN
jgi:hypothetical protein